MTDCEESKACAPAKHHYDECVERVTAAADSEEGAKEDCVEECKLSLRSASVRHIYLYMMGRRQTVKEPHYRADES